LKSSSESPAPLEDLYLTALLPLLGSRLIEFTSLLIGRFNWAITGGLYAT
jgi:hypothetical protein